MRPLLPGTSLSVWAELDRPSNLVGPRQSQRIRIPKKAARRQLRFHKLNRGKHRAANSCNADKTILIRP